MPGFTQHPGLTYLAQDIPPPRRAWVASNATPPDIVFSKNRQFMDPGTEGSRVLSSNEYPDMIILAQRCIDMRSYAFHIKERKSQEENDSLVNAQTAKQDKNTVAFLEEISSCGKEIECASTFRSTVTAILNPTKGELGRMFAFGIIPYSETAHSTMKMVYAKMGEQFQLFQPKKNGDFEFLPNAEHRMIDLCVDQLSARNFRMLRCNLSRKAAKIGGAKKVLPLLQALNRFTVQHDYLHETLLHRQDAIWGTKYGALLQAFQVHLKRKRIAGDPTKRKAQAHYKFLDLTKKALRRFILGKFLKAGVKDIFTRATGETNSSYLMKLTDAYSAYRTSWEKSDDEPSKVCVILLKEIESLQRCWMGVTQEDFWTLEIEGARWIGAFKFTVKGNCASEGMHRMDTMYGENMTDHHRETLRMNRFFNMSEEKGHAMTPDDVNEKLTIFNKKGPRLLSFAKKCERSKLILLLRLYLWICDLRKKEITGEACTRIQSTGCPEVNASVRKGQSISIGCQRQAQIFL